MKPERLILERLSAPTQYDQAPQGTFCRIVLDEQECELYIQRSSDEAIPRWEPLGSFISLLPEQKG